MAGTRKSTKSTRTFRSVAQTRRGARPAIALDTFDHHLGYFVRRLQIWIFQDFIRTLSRINVSPAQFSVLVAINANRGLSQAEVAAAWGSSGRGWSGCWTGCKSAGSSNGCNLPPTAAGMHLN